MSHCPGCIGDHLPNEEDEDREAELLKTIDTQCKLLQHSLVVEMRIKAENKALTARISELEKNKGQK
jgi:hypothetical protein